MMYISYHFFSLFCDCHSQFQSKFSKPNFSLSFIFRCCLMDLNKYYWQAYCNYFQNNQMSLSTENFQNFRPFFSLLSPPRMNFIQNSQFSSIQNFQSSQIFSSIPPTSSIVFCMHPNTSNSTQSPSIDEVET